jgi:hypothetical protein
MVDIKANLSVQIPGGPQVNAAQSLQLEAYKYFDITLDKTQATEDITLTEVKNLSLILVKATFTLAKDSTSKLMYKIGEATGTSFVELNAPLLLLGSWVGSLAVNDTLKISFKLDPKPGNDSKDNVKVEIITGWPEAT